MPTTLQLPAALSQAARIIGIAERYALPLGLLPLFLLIASAPADSPTWAAHAARVLGVTRSNIQYKIDTLTRSGLIQTQQIESLSKRRSFLTLSKPGWTLAGELSDPPIQ
jgi:DNA-binding MarR family transcriptional regulator